MRRKWKGEGEGVGSGLGGLRLAGRLESGRLLGA